jgi:hypothetical protein
MPKVIIFNGQFSRIGKPNQNVEISGRTNPQSMIPKKRTFKGNPKMTSHVR